MEFILGALYPLLWVMVIFSALGVCACSYCLGKRKEDLKLSDEQKYQSVKALNDPVINRLSFKGRCWIICFLVSVGSLGGLY